VADKNIKVGLQLGVLGTGQLKSAFGQTRREVENLKGSTDRLGRANRAAADSTVSFATRGRLALAKLRGGYDGLTRSLGGLRMAAMAAAAVPVALGVNKALSLQDLSVDLAMTAGLDAAFEKDFTNLIQSAARSGNQTHDEAGAAAKTLVDGGVRDLKALGDYLPVLTQSSTATRASMQSLSNMALASRDNMGLAADGFKDSLNMMVYASTQGKMGVQSMADAIPQLSLRMKELSPEINLSAQDLMADFVAGLQVARMGANSDAEAARNLDAFMYRIFSPETGKRFESAGVNLENSIKNLTAKGATPFEAMLDTLTTYIGSQGTDALDAFNAAVNMEAGQARDEAFSVLNTRYALGDLFVDEGVKNFTIAAMQNRQMLRDLKQGIKQAGGQDLIGADFIRRMGSAKEQMKGLGLALSSAGVTLSGPIVDGLLSVGLAILPMLQGAAAWVQQNPELVKSVVMVAGALLGARLAISGVGLAFKAGKWFVGGFTTAAKVLGSTLVWLKNGLMLAGRALMWAGRALLMNPIGLAITAIAGGAYLIIKYWQPIVGFFKDLWGTVTGIFKAAWEGIAGFFGGIWQRITTAFDGGIVGVSKLIVDWSPLGLFYQAFAGVLDWFGVELPESFTGFGGMLVDGLTGGVTKAFTKAKETIVNFGSSIKGWFSSVLDIQSPSRVFMELGGFVSEGAALGIRQQIPLAGRAVSELSGTIADAGAGLAAPATLSRAPAVNVTAPAPTTLQFSPTVHITAAPGSNVREQADQFMEAVKRGFGRLMQEYEYQQRRTAHAGAL